MSNVSSFTEQIRRQQVTDFCLHFPWSECSPFSSEANHVTIAKSTSTQLLHFCGTLIDIVLFWSKKKVRTTTIKAYLHCSKCEDGLRRKLLKQKGITLNSIKHTCRFCFFASLVFLLKGTENSFVEWYSLAVVSFAIFANVSLPGNCIKHFCCSCDKKK